MKKIITLLAVSILIIACSSEKEGNMIVQGQIKGLKKGTLYLQKVKDTVLISVDSVNVLGNEKFKLSDNVESPVIYYLMLDGKTKSNRILFFGEEGTITINDKVEQFGFNPEISGSINQQTLNQYNKVKSKFQYERLQFIKKDFEARKVHDQALILQLEKDYKQLSKKRVLYTTNFAITNSNLEVAPYIALTEMYDASLKMLDTVNNSLTAKVKASVYGKSFQEYLDNIKKSK
jgi:hypothetical protein